MQASSDGYGLSAGGGTLTSRSGALPGETEDVHLSLHSDAGEAGNVAHTHTAGASKREVRCGWSAPKLLIVGEPGDRCGVCVCSGVVREEVVQPSFPFFRPSVRPLGWDGGEGQPVTADEI